MASEESSNQQPVQVPQQQEQPVQQQPQQQPDDPAPTIKKILEIVEVLHQKVVPSPVETKTRDGETKTTERTGTDQDDPQRYIPKLRRNLRLLNEDVVKLQDLRCEVAGEVQRHIDPLDKLLKKVEKISSTAQLTKGMKKDLEEINKKIFNLMCEVPLLPNKRKHQGGLDSDASEMIINNGKGIECLPAIHAKQKDLEKLAAFRHVRDQFMDLGSTSTKQQICLLSFAVFPENQEVNRTMLMYWWIGEGILPDNITLENVDNRPEDIVKAVLKDFTERKLIEPVENKRKVEPNSYKMSPFVHSSLVLISEKIGLFSKYSVGSKPTMNHSKLHKVCLVDGSSSQSEAKVKNMKLINQIETVFNVSERFPDFTFKWFSEDQPTKNKTLPRISKIVYKNLKVFYLGRWERTAKRHIEVENPELMKYLKHMTKLKLLSFQGISRIEKLDDAVCKLHELIILDLRACYNLEKLPEKIDSLKSLIYLDITDCYMIDRMPKRLSWLDNLEVLKGFVVSDATDEEKVCLLAELKHLKNLRKLSITINKGGEFTVEKLFLDIEGFENLEKLKVAWGGINEHKTDESNEQNIVQRTVSKFQKAVTFRSYDENVAQSKSPKQLPKNLKKLDLQCFPREKLPEWIQPHKLGVLEKLYIKGGTELTGFGKLDEHCTSICNVKILRLKFLPRLKVEWMDLQEKYFPKLEFLEKYQCPQVSFCPCDGVGIWRKPKQL